MLNRKSKTFPLTQDGRADEQAEGDAQEGGEALKLIGLIDEYPDSLYVNWRRTYLLPDTREDDEKGEVERSEYDAEGDGGHVSDDGRPVAGGIQRGAAILAKQVEPAAHLGRTKLLGVRVVCWVSECCYLVLLAIGKTVLGYGW